MSSETHELRLKLPAEARAQAAALATELERVEEAADTGAEKLRGVARELREAERTAKGFQKAIDDVAAGTLQLRPENAAALAQGYEQARTRVTEMQAALASAKTAQKATTSEADRLRDGIRAATNEAKRLEREGARATATALKAAQKEAADLQRRLDRGNARELAEEMKRAANETAELKKRFADFASLPGRAAIELQNMAAATAAAFVRGIPEGSAAAERHQVVLRQLGAAYQEVQRQTRGTITAEQAYTVQQRLTESGLSLNAQQLGVVTRRARDYARTVGVDVQQALDQITEGLSAGANEQLRKFGVVVQTGHTSTETFVSALRQLEQQQRGTAPAALTAAEAQQQFQTSINAATQAAQAFLAERVGLTEFLTQAASLFRDLADGTQDWSDVLETAAGTLGEMVGLRVGGSNQGTQSTSSTFMQQYLQAQQVARTLGIDTTRMPAAGPLATRTTAEERQRILAAINDQIRARQTRTNAANAAGAAGMFGGTDLTGVRDLSQGVATGLAGEVEAIFEGATRRQDETARAAAAAERARLRALREQAARERAAQMAPVDATALADARAELERVRRGVVQAGFGDALQLGPDRFAPAKRNTQAEQVELLRERAAETQARRGENELQRLQRLTQATQAYMQAQTEQAQREQQQAQAALELGVQRRANELLAGEQRREHEQEALRQRIEQAGVLQQQAEAVNALAAAERGARDSRETHDEMSARLQQLTELREALRGLLAETDARIAQAQAEGRSQADINRLLQERIGLQRSIAQVSQEQTAIQREQGAAVREFRDQMVGALSSTADAFAGAAVAALEGSKTFGEAMREMLRSVLASLAKQSIVEALKNTALGIAALASGNVAGAPGFFAAAGLWGAVGVASGVGLAAMPKAAPASSPTAGASAGVRERPQLGAGTGPSGPLQINITVSGALMTSEQVQDGIVRGLEHAHGRGVVPRFLRPLSPSW